MWRQTWGSVVCPGCRNLVGVNDERCLNCGRWNPGLWGFAPLLTRFGRDLGFAQVVMWASIGLYVATLVTDISSIRMSGFSFLSPGIMQLFAFGASGALPVFGYGRWWTLLSASWLHGSLLHIIFNMMWVRDLAPAVAEFYGASRMMLIYVFGGLTGFLLSTMAGYLGLPMAGGISVGASAALFGLLGALIHYGRRTGSSMVLEQVRSWAIFLFIAGFIMSGVDNWAHAGGFLGGWLAGRFFDPLQPERLDHLVLALVALALSFGAIVLSLLTS